MTADPKDWIAVAALPYLGAASIKKLWEMGWTPSRLLQSDQTDWQRLNLRPQTRAALDAYRSARPHPFLQHLENALSWQQLHSDAHILPLTHPDYPVLLKEISDPPPILFVRGDVTALNLPQIAIVGSRHASTSGVRQTYQFAKHLAANGLGVNSGLALGIDSAAHTACVEAGGRTVAVFGTGPDRVYPARNRVLAASILESGGAWVSEFFPGISPVAANFPRRNRIISGMSAGVLVIEAATKSGSLITARMAMEQGREVFALPGSVNNPLSKGCHRLIKEGAMLVETCQEIVLQLAPLLGCYASSADICQDESSHLAELSASEQALIVLMGFEPITVDQLCSESGIDIQQLSQLLVELELKGVIEQSAAGYVRC